MRLKTKLAAIGAAAALAVVGAGGAARADALGPSVTFFQTPIPIIGSVLSDSSGNPAISMKDGWSVFDSDGICSATVQVYYSTTGTWTTIATFSGNSSTTKYVGHYNFSIRPSDYSEAYISATDCLGNQSSNYDFVEPSLYQEGSASYSAGWSTSACTCFSAGADEWSSKVGRTASFVFSGKMVSLVSEKASNRGKVGVYIDGVLQSTVNLYSATSINRVIVWKSKYLNTSGNHTLTLKIVSGRVDVDGFITSS